MTADIEILSNTYFLPDDAEAEPPAGLEIATPEAMAAMVAAEQQGLVREALQAREEAQVLVLLGVGALALLSVEPCADGLRVRLQSLQDVVVPEGVSDAVLGLRRQEVHDLCNNLAAARLNGELAQRMLAQQEAPVDAQVAEALAALVRVNAAVEEQMRELQKHMVLELDGSYPV